MTEKGAEEQVLAMERLPFLGVAASQQFQSTPLRGRRL